MAYYIPLPADRQDLQKLPVDEISRQLATGEETEKGIPLPTVVERIEGKSI